MADSTLNRFVSSGTTAERTAFVPDPPTPASGPDPAYLWWDTDTQTEWAYDFGLADWVELAGGGGGNVNAGGTLTANQLVIGAGSTDVAELGTLGTTTTVLHGNAAGAPTFGAVVTGDIQNEAVTLAKIQDAAANDKLLGSGNSGSGNPYEEITLGSGLTMTGTTLSASGSSSGLTLLEQHTASASASLVFTTFYSSAYDTYQIEIVDLVVATDNVTLGMEYSSDGGSSWNTTSNYYTSVSTTTNAGTNGSFSANPGAAVQLAVNVDNASSRAVQATLYLKAFGSTTLDKTLYGTISYSNQTAVIGGRVNSLFTVAGTAFNAFRVLTSSGNIASGTIRVYGLAK